MKLFRYHLPDTYVTYVINLEHVSYYFYNQDIAANNGQDQLTIYWVNGNQPLILNGRFAMDLYRLLNNNLFNK